MKLLWIGLGIVLTLTVMWAPRLLRFDDEPPTPLDWKPKIRVWKNGVEQ